MPFNSSQGSVDGYLPRHLSIWDWLFDSPYSVLRKYPTAKLRGYSNAITGERIDYAQVREVTTYISTALVKRYGLKHGDVVALFSPNNIWYPVAMVSNEAGSAIVWLTKLES